MVGQLTYLYDATFEGLATAVAMAVKAEEPVAAIVDRENHRPGLFERLVEVETDSAQAGRLFEWLRGLGGPAAHYLVNGYLAEEAEAGRHLVRLVKLCLRLGGQATALASDASIHYLARLSRRVDHEAHRLCGLLRFRVLADGVHYGPVTPDHNVIGYLAGHFQARMGDTAWIIHDLRRDLALYGKGGSVEPCGVDDAFTAYVRSHGEVPSQALDPMEHTYQQLWRSFHTVIANPDRRNLALQRKLMPARYWKYLVEEC